MNKQLKAKEAAEMLGISPGQLRYMCREGIIPFIRIGETARGTYRFDVDILQRWIQRRTMEQSGYGIAMKRGRPPKDKEEDHSNEPGKLKW